MQKLEEILREKGLLNEERTKIIAGHEEEAKEYLLDYIKKESGFPNNQIIKVYYYLKSDKFTQVACKFFEGLSMNLSETQQKFTKAEKFAHFIDKFSQGYIGGAMRKKDQNIFGIVVNEKPYKLTEWNALMSIGLSWQFIVGSKITDVIANTFTNFDSSDVGYAVAGTVAGVNLIRYGVAKITKKPSVGFSVDGILLGLIPTITSKMKKLYQNTKEGVKNGTEIYRGTKDTEDPYR